jgi:hypothetical protein
MAGKDKGGRAAKTQPAKTAKEKRQAKQDKKVEKSRGKRRGNARRHDSATT